MSYNDINLNEGPPHRKRFSCFFNICSKIDHGDALKKIKKINLNFRIKLIVEKISEHLDYALILHISSWLLKCLLKGKIARIFKW